MSSSVRMPSISFVVARSASSHIIGCENKLPWHLKTDLQRFKRITLGHVIVMGRNTFDSIGRPLPGRANIVVSRRPSNDHTNTLWNSKDTSLIWARTIEDAIYTADILSLSADKREFFIIGGDQMYRLFEDLSNRVHLTEVFANMPREAGDAYFDKEFDGRQWRILEEEEIPQGPNDEYPTRYTLYDRKMKTVRYLELENYYTDGANRKQWIADQYQKVALSIKKGAFAERPRQLNMFEKNEAS